MDKNEVKKFLEPLHLEERGLEISFVDDEKFAISSLSLQKDGGSWQLLFKYEDITDIFNAENVLDIITNNYIYRIDHRWKPPVFHLNPTVKRQPFAGIPCASYAREIKEERIEAPQKLFYDEEKWENFENAVKKEVPIIMVVYPEVLGDTYGEVIINLSKIAEAGKALIIVKPTLLYERQKARERNAGQK